MIYLSKITDEPYVGSVTPDGTTQVPTQYEGREYKTSDGKIFRYSTSEGAFIPSTTETPTVKGPIAVTEMETVEFTILNYDPNVTYTVTVSSGVVSQVGNTIKYKADELTAGNQSVTMVVTALETGKEVSYPFTTTFTVIDLGTSTGSTITIDNITIDETIPKGQGKYSITPDKYLANTCDNRNLIADGETQTTTVVKLDGTKTTVSDGDTFEAGNGETFTVKTVSPEGVLAQMEGVVSVGVGSYHTMVIKSDGTLWATGRNNFGQLGNESTIDSPSFIQIHLIGEGEVVKVCAGESHTLILKSDGSVWATGMSTYGQLGNGVVGGITDTYSSSFERVVESGVIGIAAGATHSVILKRDGSVWTTGKNNYGQLGLGDNTDRSYFTNTGLGIVSEIAAGDYHTVARKSDGVYATGYNANGQLGLSDNTDRNTFTGMGAVTFSGILGIAAGGSSTFVNKGGTLYATGYNANGQLGLGDTTDRNALTNTSVLNVKSIHVGTLHTLIVKLDGTLWATGGNSAGQLGLGDTTDRNLFTDTGLTDVKLVGAGYDYTMTIDSNGTLWATGRKDYGQTGLSSNKTSFTDTGVEAFVPNEKVVTVTVDEPLIEAPTEIYRKDVKVSTLDVYTGNTVSALKNVQVRVAKRNALFDSQDNSTTQLYLDSRFETAKIGGKFVTDAGEIFTVDTIHNNGVPTDNTNSVSVRIGDGDVALIKSDGSLWVKGNNTYGQLGLGDTVDRIEEFCRVPGVQKVVDVSFGLYHMVVLTDDGQVYATGYNANGQLGLGDTTDRNALTFTGITDAEKISAGEHHTVVLKTDGTVWVTGSNLNGQLGLGDTNDRTSFTDTGIVDGMEISAGVDNTGVIKTDGSVHMAGLNDHGQLGDGNSVGASTTFVASINEGSYGAYKIEVGAWYTVILKADGQVYATGDNGDGQLGLGDTTDRSEFTNTGFNGVKDIQVQKFAHNGYTVVVDYDGKIWGTGYMFEGQWGYPGDGITPITTSFTASEGLGTYGNLKIAASSFATVAVRDDGSVMATGVLSNINFDENTFAMWDECVGDKVATYMQSTWVVPDKPLQSVPTSMYKLPKLHINGVELIEDEVDLVSDINAIIVKKGIFKLGNDVDRLKVTYGIPEDMVVMSFTADVETYEDTTPVN